MNSYGLAVALNNDGASSMERDLSRSVGLFRRALQTLQGHLTEIEEGNVHGEVNKLTHISHKYKTNHTFHQAIKLNPSASAYSSDPLANAEVASAIVIFNLAIAYDRQANRAEDDGPYSDRPARATRLYLMALRILQDMGWPVTQSCGHAELDLMVMALFHNTGQLEYFNSNSDTGEASTLHFKKLLTLAKSLHPEVYNTEMFRVLQWYKNIFMRNASVLLGGTAAPVA
jgi:tetratricopeptide (TPR) repeat protein